MKYLFSTLLIACVSVLMSAQPKLNLNTAVLILKGNRRRMAGISRVLKSTGSRFLPPRDITRFCI